MRLADTLLSMVMHTFIPLCGKVLLSSRRGPCSIVRMKGLAKSVCTLMGIAPNKEHSSPAVRSALLESRMQGKREGKDPEVRHRVGLSMGEKKILC